MSTTPTPDRILAALDAIANNVTVTPNVYNLTGPDLLLLGSVRDGLAETASAQTAGALHQKSLVDAKDAALLDAGRALGAVAKVALASGANAAQLSAIGLARPAKPVRPTSVPAPVDLLATPTILGQVKLAWKRDGAPTTTSYVVESSADGVLWEYAAVTTRASLTLSGHAPGAQAWFRVRGSRAGLTSEPSNVASVFAPVAPSVVQLKVA